MTPQDTIVILALAACAALCGGVALGRWLEREQAKMRDEANQ